MNTRFTTALQSRFDSGAFVCIGLDVDFEKIPNHARGTNNDVGGSLVRFGIGMIEATASYAAAYKPNLAFFAAHGEVGYTALNRLVLEIRKRAPGVPIILDAKYGDIGNTNRGYAEYAFGNKNGRLDVDALTVSPYLGIGSLAPFFNFGDRTIFVLCRTSNLESEDIQEKRTCGGHAGKGLPCGKEVYLHVAEKLHYSNNKYGNIGLVVGATQPLQLQVVRKICPDMPILIPGVGAQGGSLEEAVRSGADAKGGGFVINSSRGILYASRGEDCFVRASAEAAILNDAIAETRRAFARNEESDLDIPEIPGIEAARHS